MHSSISTFMFLFTATAVATTTPTNNSTSANSTFLDIPAPHSIIERCEVAPNCETFQTESGVTQIRFKSGMEPGTTAYNATMRNASHGGEILVERADGVHTTVNMADLTLQYGTQDPPDVVHHLYDICHESMCETNPWEVASLFVGPTSEYWNNLLVHGQGVYNGWGERDLFVEAVVAATRQGVQWTEKGWSHQENGWVSTGSQWQSTQSNFIGVTKFNGDFLVGFMYAQVSQADLSGGMCGKIFGVIGSIVGGISGIGGGFFGVVSALCG